MLCTLTGPFASRRAGRAPHAFLLSAGLLEEVSSLELRLHERLDIVLLGVMSLVDAEDQNVVVSSAPSARERHNQLATNGWLGENRNFDGAA